MLNDIILFLVHCGITALSLWAASFIFHGITFANGKSLFMAALLLGLANAVIRPIIIVLTIPLTIVTFGFFLLVINALMMLLVSSVVSGFKVSGFWTAFFASIFIAVLSFFVGLFIFQSGDNPIVIPAHHGLTVASWAGFDWRSAG
jgi:putative membrane protein